MTFCRAFGWTPDQYDSAPADKIMRWRDYLTVESEVAEVRRRMDEMRSKRT